MKKLYGTLILILIIFITACSTNEKFEEGLVNFPDNSIDSEIDELFEEEKTNMPPSIPEDAVTTTEKDETTTTEKTDDTTTTEMEITTTVEVTTTTTEEPVEEKKSDLAADNVITIKEGDNLKLNLKATDPDENPITYTFSSPLNENGEWQTEFGDEGSYNVIVTASDGELTTTKNLKIVVLSSNNKPVIENIDQLKNLEFTEGDEISIIPEISDADGDLVNVKYSGFLTSNTYQTNYDDAGDYTAYITLNDGKEEVQNEIKISIANKNRAPSIEIEEKFEILEGEFISIKPIVNDPDGDAYTISFGEPLNNDGNWQTEIGDEGEYDITVSVSDKEATTTKSLMLSVIGVNNPPMIEVVEKITVNEGQTVSLNPVVSDPDGDEITITYEGFMSNNVYETKYTDAGTHAVKITATDGKASTSEEVTVIVKDQNRPPEDLQIEVIIN